MYNNRHNQHSNIDLNCFVPGLPVYDSIAGGLAERLIDFVSRTFEFFSRLGR